MKRKFARKGQTVHRQIFEITSFLREIDRVLPTIKTPEHRAVVIQMRSFLMAGSTLTPQNLDDPFPRGLITHELMQKVIETLRCCGIAPEGWPPPPSPAALLRWRQISVLGWDGTDGSGVES